MHRQLIEAARIRNIGDYGIGPEVDQETAQQLITQAEDFVRVAEDRIDASSAEAEEQRTNDS